MVAVYHEENAGMLVHGGDEIVVFRPGGERLCSAALPQPQCRRSPNTEYLALDLHRLHRFADVERPP